MSKKQRARNNSLGGFLYGCPICGGHRHAQMYRKRQRIREKRLWRKEEQTDE